MTKQERIVELQSHWRKAEAAAKVIAYQKPPEQSWDDAAVAIADLEFADSEDEINPEVEASKAIADLEFADKPALRGDYQPKGIYPTSWYEKSNIPYCSKCGERILKDESDRPFCAEGLPDKKCPVLTPPKESSPIEDEEDFE